MNLLDKIAFKRQNQRIEQLKKDKRELSLMVDHLNREILDNEKTVEHLHNVIEEQHQEIQQLKHWNKCLAEKRHNELKGDVE